MLKSCRRNLFLIFLTLFALCILGVNKSYAACGGTASFPRYTYTCGSHYDITLDRNVRTCDRTTQNLSYNCTVGGGGFNGECGYCSTLNDNCVVNGSQSGCTITSDGNGECGGGTGEFNSAFCSTGSGPTPTPNGCISDCSSGGAKRCNSSGTTHWVDTCQAQGGACSGYLKWTQTSSCPCSCNNGACTACPATPTPSPSPTPGCFAGTGTTNASCGGGVQSGCACNATVCKTKGYQCSAGQCVAEWSLGTTCPQSSCNGGAGCTATPPPTTQPTPSPTPGGGGGSCTCNGVPTQCVQGQYCNPSGGPGCFTGALCPGNVTSCAACPDNPDPGCFPSYLEGLDLSIDRVSYYYSGMTAYVGEAPGDNNVIAVTRNGKSYIALQGYPACSSAVNVGSVTSVINGTGTKPTITNCGPVPDLNPLCTVSGNNAPVGQYASTVTSHRNRGTATYTPATKNYPLSIYVIASSLSLTNSCVPGTSGTTVTLSWPAFPNVQGANIDVYCAYMDGRQQACTTNRTITLSNVPNGNHLFQVFGWAKLISTSCNGGDCTNLNANTRDPAIFGGTVAENTFTTTNGICGGYSVAGNVYIDANNNKVKDASENNYTGAITVTSSNGTTATYPSAGSFNIAGLPSGAYTIRYTNPPTGYNVTSPTATGGLYVYNVTVGTVCAGGGTCTAGSISNLNFGINPNNHTISGNVFVDLNGDRLKGSGENNYSGGVTITSTSGSVTYPSSGSFQVSNLAVGNYTVSYTSLPAGYQMSYPLNGPPPSFTVTIGANQAGCSVSSSNSAACDASGNISNLNFGIVTNSEPWIQTTGGNIRLDSGVNNQIPSNALPQCGGAYMNLDGNGGQPGIIYSGNNTANFGNGQASSTGWVVDAPDGQGYRPPTPNTIRTAYNYLLSNADQQGLTQADLATQCSGGISNCTLSSSIPSGFYLSNGDLNLTGNYTFPANKNFIILVHGNLNINGQIHVPVGSTVIFSASGDISVNKNIGEAATSTTTDIEGIFSADNDFIVDGTNDCSVGPDLRLNIAGNVIANAGLTGGKFINKRDLCSGNTCPALSITQRLDMIINLPSIVKTPNYLWQEVAP